MVDYCNLSLLIQNILDRYSLHEKVLDATLILITQLTKLYTRIINPLQTIHELPARGNI